MQYLSYRVKKILPEYSCWIYVVRLISYLVDDAEMHQAVKVGFIMCFFFLLKRAVLEYTASPYAGQRMYFCDRDLAGTGTFKMPNI